MSRNIVEAGHAQNAKTRTLKTKSLSRKRQRGQSIVELALVLPLFLLIIMATIDFGWAFRSYSTSTNAVREGARYGITGANEDAIKARVVDRSSGILELGDITVDNALGGSGENLTVSAAYDYEYLTPIGPLLNLVSGGALPNPLTIQTETVMRQE